MKGPNSPKGADARREAEKGTRCSLPGALDTATVLREFPNRVETDRLVLRRPSTADADAIFARYAADAEVTRYVGWPRHQSVEQTRAFLRFSESEWSRWPAGPYLIESRLDQRLLGSTGFGFESRSVAMTGYVLARDSWGRGYATEALMAIIDLARQLEVAQLYALCHPDNTASIRVLEKCDFLLEKRLEQYLEFPNLAPGRREECLRYRSHRRCQ